MANEKPTVVPFFYADAFHNKEQSKEKGRPIFEDRELVKVSFPGNRQTVSVFPAHDLCPRDLWPQDEDGNTRPITYAERWPDQYRRFKAKQQQIVAGTPLDELPFLTQAKRSELRALSIYTAEALSSLDGQELKNLGQGGRDLKNQAQAYLDNAAGSADVTKMASEIADLKRTISELQSNSAEQSKEESAFAEWSSEDLKDWIAERTGERPKGNPSQSTLVRRADEINTDLAGGRAA